MSRHHAQESGFGCHGLGRDNRLAQPIADRSTIIMIGPERPPVMPTAKLIFWEPVFKINDIWKLSLHQANASLHIRLTAAGIRPAETGRTMPVFDRHGDTVGTVAKPRHGAQHCNGAGSLVDCLTIRPIRTFLSSNPAHKIGLCPCGRAEFGQLAQRPARAEFFCIQPIRRWTCPEDGAPQVRFRVLICAAAQLAHDLGIAMRHATGGIWRSIRKASPPPAVWKAARRSAQDDWVSSGENARAEKSLDFRLLPAAAQTAQPPV